MSFVKKGDYIAFADGYQIVAIGKATCDSDYLRNFKNFQVSPNDYASFSLDDGMEGIVAVKVNIVDIDNEDKPNFHYEKRTVLFLYLPVIHYLSTLYANYFLKFQILRISLSFKTFVS